jgi:hypothetical protein
VAEVRCAEVLPLNPWAAAGAAGCVWRVSSMLLRLSECNALQQLRVGEPGLGSYWRKVLSSTVVQYRRDLQHGKVAELAVPSFESF